MGFAKTFHGYTRRDQLLLIVLGAVVLAVVVAVVGMAGRDQTVTEAQYARWRAECTAGIDHLDTVTGGSASPQNRVEAINACLLAKARDAGR